MIEFGVKEFREFSVFKEKLTILPNFLNLYNFS